MGQRPEFTFPMCVVCLVNTYHSPQDVSESANPPVITNNRTPAQIYGTPGQVLKSGGLGASVYWGTEGTGSGISAVERERKTWTVQEFPQAGAR